MKILITGGAGFIGSHVADAYIAQGHEVHVVDDFSTGREANVNSAAIVHRLDIADPEVVKLVTDLKPEVLNHHAAQMDVRRSVADPAFDARVNIIGFINLLQGCVEAEVKKVIFASSGGAVYGDKEPIPAGEDHPTEPLSPYGVSKRTGELYLGYYNNAVGQIKATHGPAKTGEQRRSCLAIGLAAQVLGWRPAVALDEGLQRTVDSWR
jgi:UDP-glucose 4-epimerase